MSEAELQAAEGTITFDESEVENVEAPAAEPSKVKPEESGSAPDTVTTPEKKVEFSEEQQAIFNDAIAKKTFKQREAERKAEDLARRLAELEAKVPQETRPEIPPIPNRYDDQLEAKLKARDEAIAQAAAWDARDRARSEARLQQEREQTIKQQQDFSQTVTSYTERAEKLGLSKEDLANAGKAVAAFNLPDSVARFILKDPQGPLITKYLAQNPAVLESLVAQEDFMAIAEIAAEIKPKAAGLKPKPNLPPDPAETLSGLGAREKERGPKGATFE